MRRPALPTPVRFLRFLGVLCLAYIAAATWATAAAAEEPAVQRRLYVASPGIRNDLQYGGHGLLVFDIDHGHRFLRRIPLGGLGPDGQPLNVKGICGNASTGRVFVGTLEHLICVDLTTDRQLWQRSYEGGCDRMAIAPDGSHLYLPTLEKDHWKVVDGQDGHELARVKTDSGSHNTIYGLNGREAYLAGLNSPWLTVVDTSDHHTVRTVGPFSNSVRPFTVNGSQTLCFVNVNELLGFEIGDLRTGKMLHRVEVQGVSRGPVLRHGCPSHGVGMTPDEREIWVTDGHNRQLHIFDATQMPPRQLASVTLRGEPGWITFSLDGRYAYPSTGDVIDVATRQTVTGLSDEEGREVQSEKMLEVHFQGDRPVGVGDQFGLGRKTTP
jgi:6-phosphogluconolactonase (cycloisomerase 2 family)